MRKPSCLARGRCCQMRRQSGLEPTSVQRDGRFSSNGVWFPVGGFSSCEMAESKGNRNGCLFRSKDRFSTLLHSLADSIFESRKADKGNKKPEYGCQPSRVGTTIYHSHICASPKYPEKSSGI